MAPLRKAFSEVLILHCEFERLNVLFTQPRLRSLRWPEIKTSCCGKPDRQQGGQNRRTTCLKPCTTHSKLSGWVEDSQGKNADRVSFELEAEMRNSLKVFCPRRPWRPYFWEASFYTEIPPPSQKWNFSSALERQGEKCASCKQTLDNFHIFLWFLLGDSRLVEPRGERDESHNREGCKVQEKKGQPHFERRRRPI